MKKIFVCLLTLAILLLHTPAVSTKALDFEGEYTFYTTSNFADEKCKTIQNGKVFHVSCDSSVADEIKTKLTQVVGESVSFAGSKNTFDYVCKKLGRQLFCYTVGDVTVVEGYGQNLAQSVAKNGKQVNFQVVFDGKTVTVGTPAILGSF